MYLRFFIGFLLGCFGATAALAYNFSLSTLHGVSLTTATSLQFGPDHRLYVSQVNGQILALTIQRLGPNNYQVTATETINLVRDIPNYDDNGTRNFSLTTRQVTGLLVVGTAESPILYVTSSDPRIGGGSGGENDLNLDTNSGVLSRLTRSGNSWTKVDLVRGLPRSEENHASNGMQLDAVNHRLLLAQGGNTNAGGPSINFAYASETALSAAILSIDLTAIDALPVKTDAYGQKYLYNLPTLDDPNPARNHNPDGSDVNDPFGGNDGLNQAKLVPGGPVQIYSPGHRNPYDLVLTRAPGREGRLYSFDNGANAGWGGYPKNEGPSGNVTNEYVEGEPGFVNNLDSLHLITPGFYRGHPNPIRANPAGAGWFHFDNNLPAGSQKVYSASPTTDWPPVPVAMANPVEGDFRQPGVDDGALLTYPASTNGITEYVATNFNGEMQGNLIAAAYDGKLLRIALNQAGTAVTNGVEFLASGFGAQPLDVTAPDPGHGAPFVGTIWIAHYSPGKITVLEPADFDSPGSSTCTGIDSFDVDEDGDGFSNADEIANGTDPCSGAVRPPDADGDNLSDLLDRDDDNDGLPDTEDPFPLDPRNGYSLPLPHHYELFNETGVGFFGVGFTGLMMNPGEDYLNRANEDAVVAGGTAGLFTISAADSGTPRGAENAQKDAYHFAFNSDEFTTPYLVTVRLAGPFFNNTPAGAQRQGIYIGSGDQDNYVSLALHANNGAGGIEVVYEVAGTIGFEHIYPLSLGDASTVDLSFLVDPIAATVQPLYQLAEAGALVPLGSPIHVTGEVMKSVMGPTPLAIGLFANASGGSPTFSATWDYFDIAPLPTTAVAKLTIDPSGSDMVTGSTYQTGTFKLQNLSTNGQHIESFTLDISTAIFPDVVFDTTGTAGDPVAKDFQQNSVTSGVSVNHGGATHPHNGVDGEDGYDHVDVSFNSFPPNGQLTFSIDVDPTSVKGAPQPGPHDAASVSGLELIGATATVYFSDGTVQRTRLGRLENSVDASYGWLRGDKPPKPSVLVVGKSSPVKTNHAEIVRVSGPPGLTVSLVVIEGGLYTAGLPNGGYDIDPFEANTAIKVTELSAVLNNEGYADITVTPTKTDPEAGLNFVTATLLNTNGVKGPASDPLLIWYDPSFGGSDTQPPSAPGNVSATSITSRSITLAWSAASDNVGVVGYDILRDGQLLTSTTGLTYTDIGLDPEVAYSYAIVARDESGNDSTPATVDATTTPGGTVVLRVNAGGNAFTDSHGAAWTADNSYNTGTTSSTSHAIDRAIDDTLFKSRRLDSSASSPDLIYSFTLPNGDYEVQLFFSENDTANSAVGKRVFDVLLENSVVIDNFDIFAAAGAPYTAVVLAGTTTVSDGQLNIAFGRVSGNPQVNAIKVIRLSEAPADTQAPTAPGALSFANVTSSSVTVSWAAATDNVGVTGYRVSRNGTTLTTTSNLSFTDSGLSPATTYQYSVVALDAAGNTSS
ncbi:MAG TPA: malectin domain-containing carbohydrate-binding protein, partial [Opitutus sp.]|nr:malectin domain-containing carbohydrate-binding protein [Opitutus sp.]